HPARLEDDPDSSRRARALGRAQRGAVELSQRDSERSRAAVSSTARRIQALTVIPSASCECRDLLDRFYAEADRHELRQGPTGTATGRTWRRLAIRGIVVVLVGLRVAHRREPSSK